MLKFKTKALKGKQLLGKGAYKTNIVFDREDILDLQLMRGRHMGNADYFFGGAWIKCAKSG